MQVRDSEGNARTQFETLKVHKVSKHRVEVTWPGPVSEDTCTRFFSKALGNRKWRSEVLWPAGVCGTEGVTAQELGPEPSLEEMIEAALDTDTASQAAVPATDAAAGPSELQGGGAATADSAMVANLLSLKHEVVAELYCAKDPQEYEAPHQPYAVDWNDELGDGTYGKVFVGRIRRHSYCEVSQTGDVAIKMITCSEVGDERVTLAKFAGEEVRRHVTVGLHPNIVRLVDVGLFSQALGNGPILQASLLQQSQGSGTSTGPDKTFLGLVYELYEIDVQTFLQRGSRFTEVGMRHVLNGVLHGLEFIHGKGILHADLKPANILMRGVGASRGCFACRKLDFEYQVPHPSRRDQPSSNSI